MSNLNQRQVQKLLQKLSPQQIQMIKLLELPALQLEQRIKQEIEENPVLEEEPSEDQEEEQPKEVSVEEYFAEDDTPRYKYHANNYSPDDQKRPVYLTEGMSLHEYLIEQLGFKNLSEREMTLAKYMVGSIDDDGYLRRNLSSISDDIAFSLGIETSEEELERILRVIHQLEPVGIGSRNLQECLLLQMNAREELSESEKLARKILTNYFDEFTKKHYEKLMTRLSVGEDEFRDAIEEIVHLSPKPGNLYSDGKKFGPALYYARFYARLPERYFRAEPEFVEHSRSESESPLHGDDPQHERRQRPKRRAEQGGDPVRQE